MQRREAQGLSPSLITVENSSLRRGLMQRHSALSRVRVHLAGAGRRARQLAAIAALLLAAVVRGPSPQLQAQSACGPTVNPIVCENQQPGTPSSVWDITGAGDATIQGFATNISAIPGQVEQFKINTNASQYTIDIYRMGYYAGNGARKITSITPSATLPQNQPA